MEQTTNGLQVIDVREVLPAERDAVWRLLADSSSYPDWTPIDAHEPEREGGPGGVGEVRVFVTGRYRVREEVVAVEPQERVAYVLLSGLPLRDYRAEIRLAAVGDGTEVHWRTTFKPKLPGTGWIFRRGLQGVTEKFVAGLGAAAAAG